jgi:hypothetical protein
LASLLLATVSDIRFLPGWERDREGRSLCLRLRRIVRRRLAHPVMRLAESTRRVNAADFETDRAPERAITVGLATICEVRGVLLLASGANKARRWQLRSRSRRRCQPRL